MRKLFLVMLALSLLESTMSAATIHVPADYATIQAALAAAVSGDTVLVAADDPAQDAIDGIPGYSPGDGSFGVFSGIRLIGEAGPTRCTIGHNGGYDHELVYVDEGAELAGFHVIGDRDHRPAILVIAAGSTVHHLILENVLDEGLSVGKGAQASYITVRGWHTWMGIGSSSNTSRVRNCIVTGCQNAVMGGDGDDGFDCDYILIEDCDYTYDDNPPPYRHAHDRIGSANLNACGLPVPPSDAFGMASDGGTVGGVPWMYDSRTVALELDLAGGAPIGGTHYFSGGDLFSLSWTGSTDICGGLASDLVVVLDVYGRYYFWPSWSETPGWQAVAVSPDGSEGSILTFAWPGGVGSFSPVTFYGASFVTGDISQAGFLSDVAAVSVAGS